MATDIAAAYSATGAAWERGPARIYDRLSDVVVDRARGGLRGRRVVDIGAGTGAATRAVRRAGAAAVVAVDVAVGMLHHDRPRRPPCAAGDALALPFADGAFDAAVAAFSLNHLVDPVRGLREMARVTRRSGALLVTSYAADDGHPVREAVEGALAARGWAPDAWYAELRRDAAPQLATEARCAEAAAAAALDLRVEAVRVPFPELTPLELVEWRLGMAQHAPFAAALTDADRTAVVHEALARLAGDRTPLVRSVLVMHGTRP